ncbi:metallophosphoesterase [Gordonia cholesterolivorans]|uniref:Metallophosphoesterase n=1 Tax=Gordonia cholesterolivorans TaxID=559625 RepID=A0ABN3HE82_9ACTN
MFLGDYVDRGSDSAGVVAAVKEVCDDHPGQVVALAGNHETWFINWLDDDDEDASWLLADLGFRTVRSFLPADVYERVAAELAEAIEGGSIDADLAGQVNAAIKREIVSRHGDLIAWLRRRPMFHETDTHLYVHAGVDEAAGRMWKSMTPTEMLNEKFPPTLGPNRIGKIIVAGHTGVGALHAKQGRLKCWDPYVDAGHVYLDGRVETTGVLNVMKYDAKTRETTFL